VPPPPLMLLQLLLFARACCVRAEASWSQLTTKARKF